MDQIEIIRSMVLSGARKVDIRACYPMAKTTLYRILTGEHYPD